MIDLHDSLKKVLSDTFVMYFKAHSYHWNVTGVNFPQMHDFFGKIYTELWEAIDPIAEHIRAVDAFAPTSIQRIKELTSIDEEESSIPSDRKMVMNLLADNNAVLQSLKEAFDHANHYGEDGLANFIQDRMDIHKKHAWMLKSILS